MEKRFIYNKETLEKREVNEISLSKRLSEKLNIPEDDLKDILKDVKEIMIESFKEIINQKDENGCVENNFIVLENVCAFVIKDCEKDDKKCYGISTSIHEDIVNSINDVNVKE